ncbi:MAG: hypothetical protein ACHQW9_00010 [Nitrososphaerales archaeon]
MRQHSIRAAMKEILNIAKSTGAVQINLCGMPGQGKTTFSLTAAHLLHQLADVPFTVKRWGREQLLNIEEEIKKLPGMNYIFIFDDISWLQANAPKQKIDQIIKTMTEIRHLQTGDFQVISFFNFHYSYAVPKPMRNAQFWFYFSIGSSEYDNVIKLVGQGNSRKVNNFRRVHGEAQGQHKKFDYYFGKYTHTYDYRKPMAPCLFWNGNKLRDIVFPSREWIDPICDVCLIGNAIQKGDQEEFEDFAKDVRSKYGEDVIRTALRIRLLTSFGINTWNRNIVQVGRYIDDYMKHKPFGPEILAKGFNLEETKTTTHYKIPERIKSKQMEDNTN